MSEILLVIIFGIAVFIWYLFNSEAQMKGGDSSISLYCPGSSGSSSNNHVENSCHVQKANPGAKSNGNQSASPQSASAQSTSAQSASAQSASDQSASAQSASDQSASDLDDESEDDSQPTMLNDQDSCSPVTVYCTNGFQGGFLKLGVGRGVLSDLGLGKVGSLRIMTGYRVTLFEQPTFSGNSRSFTEDTPNVTGNWSSIEVIETDSLIGAVLFTGTKFTGAKLDLLEGKFNLADLGLNPNNIKSIQVRSGFQVYLYNHRGQSGLSVKLTGPVDDLGPSWGHPVGSVNIERVKQSGGQRRTIRCQAGGQIDPIKVVSVYTGLNGTGNQADLVPGRYNMKDLEQRGIENDRIKSVAVLPGYSVVLYEHANFQGATRVIESSLADLGPWKDQTSSLVVSMGVPEDIKTENSSSGPVTVYQSVNFVGSGITLQVGNYDLPQLRLLGVKNDSIESVRVKPGHQVTLYEHSGFKGRQLVLTEDTQALEKSWLNQTSSIKIEEGDFPAKSNLDGENYRYLGCYRDTKDRALPHRSGTTSDREICRQRCKDYRYFGLQYNGQCFCGNDLERAQKYGKTDQCPDSGLGGNWTFNLYENEQVSSPDDTSAVTIYRDTKFRGQSAVLGVGRYTLDQLPLGNDNISSLIVKEGYQVTLFEDNNFKGKSITLTGQVPQLSKRKVDSATPFGIGDFNWNDETSSIIVEKIK